MAVIYVYIYIIVDLKKFKELGIVNYAGSDIAMVSVNECRERYNVLQREGASWPGKLISHLMIL